MKSESNMHSGRRPSPEGTKLVFVGTIIPMIRAVDGPTKARHERPDGRQDKKRAETELRN